VTRIVGGGAGGRRLAVPPGSGTRPTADQAREGLFNTLAALLDLSGAAVLDLYAGSGAIGLEALSRGADRALFVESDPRAARTIRANAARLDATGARVLADRVERVLAAPPAPGAGYDLVFADPPYATADAEVDRMLASLADRGWLADGAVLVVERARRSPAPNWPTGVAAVKSRRYGEAVLWYGRRP
jgi:16S rRNA (guanine966-N2)-methyltransferase